MSRHLFPLPVALAVTLLLPGCVLPVPVAASADQPAPTLLRAPADWGALAHDAAYRVMQRASQQKALTARPLVVVAPVVPTHFSRALHQYLLSSLVELGLTVSQRDDTPLKVTVDVHPVRLAVGMQLVVTASIGDGQRYLFRMTDAYVVDPRDAAAYEASLLPAPPAPPPPPTPTRQFNLTATP
ncbi:hypothetical protein [Chitinimonas lacunae]|uniref:FlgO domain-containing protein n=1 Tax=Chitinimonas lacunae TaxID=1963018 RepID=A0ABV8MLS3_9NEIS